MERPTSITLDVKYNRDGTIDDSSLIIELESALGGRLCITDWYGESHAQTDYPHLNEDERRAVISSIQIGDYDEAVDQDMRRATIDSAVIAAGLEGYPDADDEDADHTDDSAMAP